MHICVHRHMCACVCIGWKNHLRSSIVSVHFSQRLFLRQGLSLVKDFPNDLGWLDLLVSEFPELGEQMHISMPGF